MSIDEELLLDEQATQREVDYIRERLPIDAKDSYDDRLLRWMLDAIAGYYCESGILDTDADEVDIDMDEVARYVCQQARQEGLAAELDAQEVRLVAEADLDFQEMN